MLILMSVACNSLAQSRVGRMSIADRVPGISEYGSVDPAPPSTESDISELRKTLLDEDTKICLLYTSPSPRDKRQSRMPSSA